MTSPSREKTSILLTTSHGDPASAKELVQILYAELKNVAQRLLADERKNHTLQPTALVNELWLKLIDDTKVETEDRARFMGLAARAMRQILVNHARTRKRQKRGGDWARDNFDSKIAGLPERSTDLIALDEEIEALHALKPRVAQVVEMRFFGGMTVEEVATALEISPRTVADDWQFARAWLARELRRGDD